MQEDEFYNTVDLYLSDEMTNPEKLAFETALNDDPFLAQEFELYKDSNNFLADSNAIHLEKQLNEIGDKFVKNYPPKKKKQTWVWLGAASIVFALIAFSWFYSNVNTTNNLYAQYYETYELNELERSNDSSSNTDLEKGIDAYSNHNYDSAKKLLEAALSSNNTEKGKITFFLSMIYLEEENWKEAKESLTSLSSKPSIYQQQANWYLALIALKEGKTEDCKSLLNKVLGISKKGVFAKKANSLLKQLSE